MRSAADVVFVENHDSFSYNIVSYLRMLGAGVRVVDHRERPDFTRATHLVVGPGPGGPATAGRTLDWVSAAIDRRIPLLGVCLGHQALGVVCGARLDRAPSPVHGEGRAVRHTGRGLFAGIPDPAVFARYNSLILTDLPAPLSLEGWSDDGLVMAIALRDRPAWGIQFHPESVRSEEGLKLIANFLRIDIP
jgi:anthranilate synthase